MPHVNHYLPEITEPERSFLEQVTSAMADAEIQQFAIAYRRARKDPQTILLMAVIGVFAVQGLHRLYLGQVGMGLLYLFTWGLMLFGTITDIVRHKELTLNYNRELAMHIAMNLPHSRQPFSTEPGMAFG